MPYIIFNILGYIKHIFFSKEVFSISNCIHSIYVSDTMPLWFLRELFILVLLAPIIYVIREKKLLVCGSSILILILAGLGIAKYRSFLYWLSFYIMGTFGNTIKMRRWITLFKNKKINLFLIISMYLILIWFLPNTTGKMDYYGNFMFYLFRGYSIIIWTILMGYLTNYNIKKYSFMGYSFWVYCIHFPLISLCLRLLEKYIKVESSVIECCKYFGIIIMVYSLCILLGWGMQKYTPKIWKILNGGRNV